ncbi:MAG: glycosyltransferase [Planctomycetota bacterium]
MTERVAFSLTVIVPTLRRVDDLARCLSALGWQQRVADEVLVTVQEGDHETREFLERWATDRESTHVREVRLYRPGLVRALQRGAEEASGDVLVFIDDDAVPRPDWLRRIEAHFLADPLVVGVGGRDWVHELGQTLDGSTEEVGRVKWYGKLVGNHHLGVGLARRVDLLKGVNMAFRREPLLSVGFDERLRGSGAQVGNEIAVCLPLRRAGWELVYDPAVALDHYPSVRHDADKRYVFEFGPNVDATHNETLPVLEHLGWPRRWVYLCWALGVGTRRSWGLAQFFRFLPSRGVRAFPQLWAAWRGRWLAFRTARRGRAAGAEVMRPSGVAC